MPKTSFLFVCTEEFKDALGVAANKANMSASEYARNAIAKAMEYNLANEAILDKRRKYESKEIRIEEQKKRQKAGRDNLAKLLALYEHQKLAQDREIIANSLLRRGVSLDEDDENTDVDNDTEQI